MEGVDGLTGRRVNNWRSQVTIGREVNVRLTEFAHGLVDHADLLRRDGKSSHGV